MDRKWILVLVIIAIIVVVGVIFAALYFGTYNSLVELEVDVDQKWADVEAVLQRRFDLIPNVVDAAKLYIEYEGSILENITMLRSQWSQAQASGDQNVGSSVGTSVLRFGSTSAQTVGSNVGTPT